NVNVNEISNAIDDVSRNVSEASTGIERMAESVNLATEGYEETTMLVQDLFKSSQGLVDSLQFASAASGTITKVSDNLTGQSRKMTKAASSINRLVTSYSV
ncbi:MAG: hypothetical protein HQL50_03005, partial [Magnetococcales bacterium]|nr:hypothetical protein [Magnetococcales bacterium]